MKDMRSPKVSVIMPVFNGAKFIRSAIESVLSQTMNDWELIIVNDGSTDNTAEILEQFYDPRIHVFQQINSGEAAARNAAMQNASGEYIAFLDADDLYLPDALQKLEEFLRKHTEFGCVYSDGHVANENDQSITKLSDYRPGNYIGNIFEHLALSAIITCPSCTMFRHEVIEKYKLQFDPNIIIGPDWDFWVMLARHIQFGYLDSPTVVYRIHQTNISRTAGQNRRKQDFIYIKMKLLNSGGFDDLSKSTRVLFFYNLLVVLLSGNPQLQEVIIHHSSFRKLPLEDRANLLRQVGIDYILQSVEPNRHFSKICILEAIEISPLDYKNKVALGSLYLGKPVLVNLVRIWRMVHSVVTHCKSFGKRIPISEPFMLQCKDD